MIQAGSQGTSGPRYLLLKATALYLPVRDDSVSLVIATPPDFGSKRFGKADFCTTNPQEYQQLLEKALAECVRIVESHGRILVLRRGGKNNSNKVIDVYKKRLRGRRCVQRIRSESFHVHYVNVQSFHWQALPVSFYRILIHRYSAPGQYVTHVFSGSGNSGIAAMQLARTPILIDLHYQRQTQARLNRKLYSLK